MSAIVGQEAMAKVAHALAAAGEVRQLLTDAHLALTVTQKEVGLGTRMFGAGVKPASAKMVDEGSNDRQGADAPAFAQAGRSARKVDCHKCGPWRSITPFCSSPSPSRFDAADRSNAGPPIRH